MISAVVYIYLLLGGDYCSLRAGIIGILKNGQGPRIDEVLDKGGKGWSSFIGVLSGYYYFYLLILKKAAFNNACYAFNF